MKKDVLRKMAVDCLFFSRDADECLSDAIDLLTSGRSEDALEKMYELHFFTGRTRAQASDVSGQCESIKDASFRRSIPSKVRRAVFQRDGSKCQHCGTDGKMHVDHRLPWSRGGLPTLSNLWLLCAKCNLQKGAQSVEEWRGYA